MAYIGASPGNVAKIDYFYTATASQTLFSGPDDNNNLLNLNLDNVDVYINGILISDQNYTVLSNSVTFNNGLSADDVVTIRSFGTFDVADTYTKNQVYTKGESYSRSETENMVSGFRNKIINGDFDIWQRATSQTLSGYGSADRWSSINFGTTKVASQQAFSLGQTSVPGNPEYFMRHVVTSVTGASHYAVLWHKIEGVRSLAGKTITATFWAKADTTKNIGVEFLQSFGTGGSPSAQVDGIGSQLLGLTTSWQKFSVTISLPSISTKVLGSDNNDSLQIMFWFDAGSNWNTRSANLGQQSGTFDIAHVSLVEGDVTGEDDPFEERHIAIEQILCERYYRLNPSLQGAMNGSNTQFICHSFIEGMRITTPTAIVVNASGTLHHPGSAFRDISSISSLSEYYITLVPSANFGANVSGQVKQGSIAADAEL